MVRFILTQSNSEGNSVRIAGRRNPYQVWTRLISLICHSKNQSTCHQKTEKPASDGWNERPGGRDPAHTLQWRHLL